MGSKAGRAGGHYIHLDEETRARVEEYRKDLQEGLPGLTVTINGAMANLIHLGLKFAEFGPFERVDLPTQAEGVPQ